MTNWAHSDYLYIREKLGMTQERAIELAEIRGSIASLCGLTDKVIAANKLDNPYQSEDAFALMLKHVARGEW